MQLPEVESNEMSCSVKIRNEAKAKVKAKCNSTAASSQERTLI